MKTYLVIALITAASVPGLAVQTCVSEAQVTRVIKSVQLDPSGKSCKAFLDMSILGQKDSYFSTFSDEEIKKSNAKLCKLELQEIAQHGIEVGTTEDGHCSKEAGDEIDGAVQKTSDSGIILKNLSI
ncbi:MAG: hypothetical protein JNM24_02220 [Bdellovibrionaceae bacterium]|nr:hypothetical protein [Pseudobdellovibrionaceae bacterium]